MRTISRVLRFRAQTERARGDAEEAALVRRLVLAGREQDRLPHASEGNAADPGDAVERWARAAAAHPRGTAGGRTGVEPERTADRVRCCGRHLGDERRTARRASTSLGARLRDGRNVVPDGRRLAY